MKLTANSMTYTLAGDDGYSFTVDAVHDPEFGWSASVCFTSQGLKTAESAAKRLRPAAEAFLRALKEMEAAPVGVPDLGPLSCTFTRVDDGLSPRADGGCVHCGGQPDDPIHSEERRQEAAKTHGRPVETRKPEGWS